ncbi:MAG TPA: biotin/lipoyl-containing protein, partial [Solirubrobacteraceae bacterium]|nr:biotin/lipoyl-containing protein [Solirubrobacteraceae bacterium]
MADVAMPRLSDSMEEGTILKWLKSDGDSVERGEELVEIETDKANMTYEADEAGTLKIVAQEGDTLAVGATIAKIGDDAGSGGEDAGSEGGESEETEQESQASGSEREPGRGAEDAAQSADSEREADEEAAPVATEPEPEPAGDGGENGRVKASPVARRMAQELGVDLGSLKGSGPGGRIVKSDVEAAASNGGKAGEAAPAAAEEPAPEPEKKGKDVPGPVVSGDRGSGRGET